ncbi:hypothetical protein PspTeo4_25768 [Pseudomonas sp. Teo4]|nr:hypothetical protein [Pseudomonas sp. Teo4]
MRRRFDRATASARMIRAAMRGASFSIFSSESLPRVSQQLTVAGGDATGRATFAVEHGHFTKGPAFAQGSDFDLGAIAVGLAYRDHALMQDAHEGASIAFIEDGLAFADGGQAEIASSGLEVAELQGIEQAAVHEHVADFGVQESLVGHVLFFFAAVVQERVGAPQPVGTGLPAIGPSGAPRWV